MMKRRFIELIMMLSFIWIALSLDSFAQIRQSNQTARKFDEFGDIYMTDIKARIDGFAEALRNEPNARGFIIVYRTRRDLPGLSSRWLIG
jgi:hypothetical protein